MDNYSHIIVSKLYIPKINISFFVGGVSLLNLANNKDIWSTCFEFYINGIAFAMLRLKPKLIN